MTDDVVKTRNSLVMITIVLGIICLVIGMFFVDNIFPWIVGIAIGVIICAFRVFSMSRSLEKAVEMTSEDAKNYTRAHYMLRYIISFVIAVIACYKGLANPVGVIVGLVLLQPAVYIYNFIDRRNSKKS